MVSNRFSISGTNEIIMNGEKIDTNISLFNEGQFQERFFADIIKDGNTIPKIEGIVGKLKSLYNNNENIPLHSYHTVLIQLERQVFDNPTIKKNVDELTNVLRTSTIGSNTQISDAKIVFRESGNSPSSICRKEDLTIVGTPASLLDSAGKGDSDKYFPYEEGQEIIFDNLFTFRLGFPNNLLWKTKYNNNSHIVSITDENGLELSGNINMSNKDRGIFGQYVLGNHEKNIVINSQINVNPYTKILLLIKELGDVAQVWMYFAFVNITKQNPTDCVMITTDSVVYLFCILLRISCVYTGARKGVEHGCCTIKHYLAGPVNYEEMLKNKVEIEYKHLMNNIISIQNIINKIILEINENQNKIWFYCKAYGRRDNTKIFLNKNTLHPEEVNWFIATIREKLLDKIVDKKNSLESIYNDFNREFENIIQRKLKAAEAAEAAEIVDNYYKYFLNQITEYMLPQIVTKHATDKTISLNNVEYDEYNFLQRFIEYHNNKKYSEQRGKLPSEIKLLNLHEIQDPISTVIATQQYEEGYGTMRGGAMPLKIGTTYVVEFNVICYILMIHFKLPIQDIQNIQHAIQFIGSILYNNLKIEQLAVLYDLYANNINIEAFKYYSSGQTPYLDEIYKKLEHIDKDIINNLGLIVSRFIDFESKSEDEINTHYEIEAENIYIKTIRQKDRILKQKEQQSQQYQQSRQSRQSLQPRQSLQQPQKSSIMNKSFKFIKPITQRLGYIPEEQYTTGFGGKKNKTRKHKTRKHKTRKHKTRKHKIRKHKPRKHKTRKHKPRKHKPRKHKTRKHKTRKNRK